MPDPSTFVPLRSDPPPTLATTLWTRSALALAILVMAVAVLVVDLLDRSREVFSAPPVVVAHLAVAALLIVWSGRAMNNVDAIMPATRYGRGPSARLARILWVCAFAVPAGAVVVVERVGSEFADVESTAPTIGTILIVLVALLAAWLPFRYHVLQGARIGAPHLYMALWFWAPLGAFVAGLSILAFAYRDRFGAEEGGEWAIGVGGIYGLAAGVFAWSTWRAVTVFDEVIDLRWRRWRSEWEQTLADMAAEPAPPPER